MRFISLFLVFQPILIKYFLDADSTSGNRKTHGPVFTKFIFKLEHIDNTQTNETNNTTRDYDNSYERNKRPWKTSREICY